MVTLDGKQFSVAEALASFYMAPTGAIKDKVGNTVEGIEGDATSLEAFLDNALWCDGPEDFTAVLNLRKTRNESSSN